MNAIEFTWRGFIEDRALNELHAEAFAHPLFEDDWAVQLENHSLGWVTARDAAGLVGFVNVVWDGASHSWLQDTAVAKRVRHEGVGRRLVAMAAESAREAGCEWLHVDFDDHHADFYFGACGFQPTSAGVMRL